MALDRRAKMIVNPSLYRLKGVARKASSISWSVQVDTMAPIASISPVRPLCDCCCSMFFKLPKSDSRISVLAINRSTRT